MTVHRTSRELGILAYGMMTKSLILMRRYRFDTALQLVSVYVFFFVLFTGGTAVGGAQFADSLEAIIVGFFLFSLTTAAYSAASSKVLSEAQWGTLEQLYISPHGFGRLIVVGLVIQTVLSLAIGSVLLLSMMATTGRYLVIDVLTVLPILLLTLLPAMGVGLVFGGLALLYKRVQSAFQLVQFAFIGLIAAPVGSYPGLEYLPVALGSHLLQRAMTEGTHLFEFEATSLVTLAGVGVCYFVVGFGALRLGTRLARERGVLGHY